MAHGTHQFEELGVADPVNVNSIDETRELTLTI